MQQAELDFTAAKERANTGMRRAADRACRKTDPLWVETAVLFLASFAREQGGKQFTIEQARTALAGKVADPPDGRAWGQVTRMARDRKIIVQVGIAPAASSNGSLKPAYESGPGAV